MGEAVYAVIPMTKYLVIRIKFMLSYCLSHEIYNYVPYIKINPYFPWSRHNPWTTGPIFLKFFVGCVCYYHC